MASDYNKLLALGNIGSDPELKFTQGGEPHLHFSLACNEEWVGKDQQKQKKTTWIRCIIWGKRGEALHRYLIKGSRILVDGKLSIREYNDRDGVKRTAVECIVGDVTFAGGKTKTAGEGASQGGESSGGSGRSRGRPAPPPQAADEEPAADEPADGGSYANDDDIPF